MVNSQLPPPKINHEHAAPQKLFIHRETEMDEASFLQAGDDFDAPAVAARAHSMKLRLLPASRKLLVATTRTSIAGMLLRGLVKALQYFDGVRHGFGREQAGLKDRGAEASDFAVLVNDAQAAARKLRDLEAHGVGADVHRREDGHGLRLYKRNPRK
jgi:hypothetical protein